MDPDSQVHIKLVARQEHPTEFAHELDGREHVVHVIICLEIIKIQSGETHTQEFMPLVKCLFIETAQGKVDAEDLLAIHSCTATARSCLDTEEVV